MLFLNFSSEKFEAFKSNLNEAAKQFKGKDINFLIGDIEASQGAFQVCHLSAPLIFIIFYYVFCKWLSHATQSITQYHFAISTL